jgi:GNAT superfamily N-acetyltransferase
MEFRLAAATRSDVPLILQLIRLLAEYEQLAGEAVAREADLERALFGPRPAAEVILGYAGDEPAGFALYFQTFSTFKGRPGLYLEDIFVKPEWRRQGLAQQLLARLARIAVERGYGRMEWSVLNWNETALRVYRAVGARPMNDWTVYRLNGAALRDLAAKDLGNGGGRVNR